MHKSIAVAIVLMGSFVGQTFAQTNIGAGSSIEAPSNPVSCGSQSHPKETCANHHPPPPKTLPPKTLLPPPPGGHLNPPPPGGGGGGKGGGGKG